MFWFVDSNVHRSSLMQTTILVSSVARVPISSSSLNLISPYREVTLRAVSAAKTLPASSVVLVWTKENWTSALQGWT